MLPVVRVVDAGLGPAGQVDIVVSGVDQPDRLRSAWAASGASVESRGGRLRATSTIDALARAAGRALDSHESAALERAARRAVAAWTGPTAALALPQERLDLEREPAVMGILNITPDSFADGGRLYPAGHPGSAVEAGRRLAAAGARILDVGGESTRPGSEPVDHEEELRRVVPVVRALAAEGLWISVDTTKPDVAREALAAGARIVNDVGAGRNPELLAVVAESGAGYVLMHARGTPADMRERTHYDDVVAEVYEFLAEGLARCADVGVPAERIVVDPGIGFAKTAAQSMALLRATAQLRSLGRPVLVGASRKSFLATLLDDAPVTERLEGSLAVAALTVGAGAGIVRAHDVAETVRVVRVARALRAGA